MNKKAIRMYIDDKKQYNNIKSIIQVLKSKDNEYDIYKNKKNLFLMMLPTYGNIGDQAITMGSIKFIEEYFSDFNLINVNLQDTCKKIKSIKKIIKKDDLVFLQGGGNMGNLYPYIENYRRFIIKNLKNFNIISLPVTVTFTNDAKGKKELKKSKKIYNSCKNFTIIAREKFSYDFLKSNKFAKTVLLSPDIALNIEPVKENKYERQDILICVRHDQESANSKKSNEIIKKCFKKENSRIIDTTITREVNNEFREIEVKSMMNELQTAKAVITDRMHCMILCALTGTQCIAYKALDNKIIGSYEWIKDSKNIHLVDVTKKEAVWNILNNLGNESSFLNFDDNFKTLANEIKNINIKEG